MIPRLSMGPKDGWPIYLDRGAIDLADELFTRIHRHLWGLTANAGLDVRVTTILPNLLPNFYTVVMFRPEKELAWRPGKPAHAGNGPYRNAEELHYSGVEVSATAYEPEMVAAITAHELGHALSGLPGHEVTPNNIMGEPVPVAGQWSPRYRKAINALIADVKAGWRLGYHDGAARVERFNIKTGIA